MLSFYVFMFYFILYNICLKKCLHVQGEKKAVIIKSYNELFISYYGSADCVKVHVHMTSQISMRSLISAVTRYVFFSFVFFSFFKKSSDRIHWTPHTNSHQGPQQSREHSGAFSREKKKRKYLP